MRHRFAILLAAFALPLSMQSAQSETLSYGYDELGRLVGAVSDMGVAATTTSVYKYDNADNRSQVMVGKADSARIPIFRFYYSTGRHFYGRNFMEGHNAGLTADGPTFYTYAATATGRNPLFRCYDAPKHFISISNTCEGKTLEGTMGYAASTTGTGLSALYRCYRSSDQDYMITINQSECTSGGYSSEGILGYVP
jgi:YD repeat-containing protein